MDQFWLGLSLDSSSLILTIDPKLYQKFELPASGALGLAVKTLLNLAKVALILSVRLSKE